MGMAVYAAGKYQLSACVDLLRARRQVAPYRCDGLAIDRHIGRKHCRGGRDGAAAQYKIIRLCGHGMVSGLFTSPRLRERVRGPLHESELLESPPPPDPLPASGEREK